MSERDGLIIFFDEERRSDLIQELSEGGYSSFSDALSVDDWDIKQNSLALLSFSPEMIDYICIASKGNRVATSKSRVNFSEIVKLGQIRISKIESRLNENVRRYFISSTQGYGGRVPKQTWQKILEAIAEINPNVATEIARLRSLGKYSGYRLHSSTAEVLMQEREALGISLEIFSGNNKLRDSVLRTWAPAEDSVIDINDEEKEGKLELPSQTKSSFLRGISSRYFQEESALQHDLFNWNGMTPCHESGVSVFQSGQRKLEIIYANKNDLEKTLGVDLIYYNDTYKSFTLLQYKLMKQNGSDEFYYRPDKQLEKELARMTEFSSKQSSGITPLHEDYRLCTEGFLLKLVPNRGLQPASGELIKGMYLTKTYVDFLLSEHGPKGDRDGRLITFKNSPRYLTNVEFAQMVNRGWIGTAGTTSEAIGALIKEFYESGRALLVAYETVNG
jgi:hypothetical protein